MNFNLKDLDGTTCKESYNNTDKNKKIIYNGDVKYFRDFSTGRWFKGVVYHNINNMWWVIINNTKRTNISSFELFDKVDCDFSIRRLARDRTPEEYKVRREKINKTSTKELLSELKRRKAI